MRHVTQLSGTAGSALQSDTVGACGPTRVLSLMAWSQVPDDHDRGEHLDDRDGAEPDQRQRRRDRPEGDRQHGLPDVPSDRGVFQSERDPCEPGDLPGA